MADFPDFLYRLTPRDEQVTPLEIITQRLTGTGATLEVETAPYVVPLGKVLIIKSVSLRLETAGASVPRTGIAKMFLDNSVPIEFYANAPVQGATTSLATGSFSDVYAPEGWSVSGRGIFSVAVAGNNVFFMMSGILVPRGNFAI